MLLVKVIAITLWWVFVSLILIALIVAVIKSAIETHTSKPKFGGRELTDDQALKLLKSFTEILEEETKEEQKDTEN